MHVVIITKCLTNCRTSTTFVPLSQSDWFNTIRDLSMLLHIVQNLIRPLQKLTPRGISQVVGTTSKSSWGWIGSLGVLQASVLRAFHAFLHAVKRCLSPS